MRPQPSRHGISSALLVLALAAGGCARWVAVERRSLTPVAATSSHPDRPYAQVRAVALYSPSFHSRFADRHAIGGTVDVANRTGEPLAIDLASATLTVESVGEPDRATLAPMAAGSGELPRSVSPRRPTAITLEPGGHATVWLVFERPQTTTYNPRVTLRLPHAAGTASLDLTLLDPASGRPRWSAPERRFTWGLGLRGTQLTMQHLHTSMGAALWLGWSPFRFAISTESFDSRESIGGRETSWEGNGLALEASVRPADSVLGLHLAAGLASFRSDDNAPERLHHVPTLSVALEAAITKGLIPHGTLRLGYAHRASSDVASRHALMFQIEIGASVL
jgi:hypothetical protein